MGKSSDTKVDLPSVRLRPVRGLLDLISRDEAESIRSSDLQRELVQLIEEGLPITVLDPFKYVCTDTWCPTRIDGRDLYFDNNHLTIGAAARLELEFTKQLSSVNS